MLAPRRGLTATETQARHARRCESIRSNDQVQSAGLEAYDTGWPTTTRKERSETILPDLSNFYCLPAEPGDLEEVRKVQADFGFPDSERLMVNAELATKSPKKSDDDGSVGHCRRPINR